MSENAKPNAHTPPTIRERIIGEVIGDLRHQDAEFSGPLPFDVALRMTRDSLTVLASGTITAAEARVRWLSLAVDAISQVERMDRDARTCDQMNRESAACLQAIHGRAD